MLNRPVEWGILVQRAMNARFIIIRGIPTQDPPQVRLPEYDHVVETFPSDRADQSLDVRVLPGRSGSSRLVPNAHGTQPLPEDQAITTGGLYKGCSGEHTYCSHSTRGTMAPFKPKPRQPPMTKAELRAQGIQALAQVTTPIIKLPMKIRRQCGRCGDFNSVLVEPGQAVPAFKCSACGYAAG
jgi:hypothetical protein